MDDKVLFNFNDADKNFVVPNRKVILRSPNTETTITCDEVKIESRLDICIFVMFLNGGKTISSISYDKQPNTQYEISNIRIDIEKYHLTISPSLK